ncbi:MAG TPA: hypothetical protein PLA50_16420 [Bacteroidia bacterium]|nr:hypothetical protein [Bacteroidia bacterium]
MKRAFVPAVLHRIEAADGEFDHDGTAGRRSALRLLLETVAVE